MEMGFRGKARGTRHELASRRLGTSLPFAWLYNHLFLISINSTLRFIQDTFSSKLETAGLDLPK
jgi:hypothetical protein